MLNVYDDIESARCVCPGLIFGLWSMALALPLDGATLTTLPPPKAFRYPSKPLRPMVKSISTTLSANALDRAFTSVALWATKPSPERLPSIFSCSI